MTTKKEKNKSHTKEHIFRKVEVQGKKRGLENGPKAEQDKTERATRLGRRTKEIYIYLEKWDQTNSPKIPDRGEDIRNPRPPFGGRTYES